MGAEFNLNDYLTEKYEALKADFPSEAYSVDKSRGFALTSLKAQYLVERLNDVLGINGWTIQGSFTKEDNGGMSYLGNLHLKVNGEIVQTIEAIGYSDKKKNIGDMLKSARKDALSKAASYIGVGNEMFKGNVAPGGGSNKTSTPKTTNTTTTTTNTKSGSGFSKPKVETNNEAANDGWS